MEHTYDASMGHPPIFPPEAVVEFGWPRFSVLYVASVLMAGPTAAPATDQPLLSPAELSPGLTSSLC